MSPIFNFQTLLSVFWGLLGAVLAWQFNKASKKLPVNTPVLMTPLIEESAKTLPALFFSANLLLVHFVFGAVEGVWEIYTNGRNGIYTGLSALASHCVFGGVTLYVFELQGALLPALAAGCLVHTAWNYAVLTYFSAG